jgi:sarcosine oxidase subunit beta
MTIQTADVVIIGAGSTGLSAAYELAKAGVNVLVVDRRFLAMEASGRNMGGIRQVGRDRDDLPLIAAAMRRWRALPEELGCDLELAEDGYLWVALSEKELELECALAKRDIPYGIKEYVLDQRNIKEIAPAISDIVIGGVYSPTDLIANPFLVAKGYYTNAKRYGAKFLFDTEVTGLKIEGKRIRGVVTTQGEIATNLIINATGAWSDHIGRMAGIDIPISPCPDQIILTEPMPAILPSFLLISSIAVCRQSKDGHVYIGDTNAPGGISGFSKATNYGGMILTVTNILKIVPAFRKLNIIRTWVGTLDFSPDDTCIFGRVEEVEGLILASGCSGHGFALAPILGQLLCELVVQGKTTLPVEAFRLDRFKQGNVKKIGGWSHPRMVDTPPQSPKENS